MARKITRVEDAAPVAPVVEAPVAPVVVAPVVEAPKPVETLKSETVSLTGVSALGIRVAFGYVFFNNGHKMKRIPVRRDKPITVTIQQ